MAATKRIKRALVSVYHKDGLDEILKKLHREGVSFVSTGGTQKFIEELGLPCDAVEDLTGYPSILGGRVKTLHPKVFGGILNRRDNEGDQAQIAQYEIPEIDLVIGRPVSVRGNSCFRCGRTGNYRKDRYRRYFSYPCRCKEL